MLSHLLRLPVPQTGRVGGSDRTADAEQTRLTANALAALATRPTGDVSMGGPKDAEQLAQEEVAEDESSGEPDADRGESHPSIQRLLNFVTLGNLVRPHTQVLPYMDLNVAALTGSAASNETADVAMRIQVTQRLKAEYEAGGTLVPQKSYPLQGGASGGSNRTAAGAAGGSGRSSCSR